MSPRLLLLLLVVLGATLAVGCAWLGYHLGLHLFADEHHQSESERRFMEKVQAARKARVTKGGGDPQNAEERLRQAALRMQAASLQSGDGRDETAECGGAAEPHSGGALGYIIHSLSQGMTEERKQQILEEARMLKKKKKDEL